MSVALPARATEYWFIEGNAQSIKKLAAFLPENTIALSQSQKGLRWKWQWWPPQILSRETTLRLLLSSTESSLPDALKVLNPVKVDKVTIDYYLYRVSDINGWGTDINGEVHYRAHQIYSGPLTEDLVQFIRHGLEQPFLTFESAYPPEFSSVISGPSPAFERGFVLRSRLQVNIVDMLTTKTRSAFQTFQESQYYRAGSSVSFIAGAAPGALLAKNDCAKLFMASSAKD